MLSSSERADRPLLPSATARGLSLAGLVLLVLFLTIIAGALFPIALLDPAWQLRLGGALINAAPVALTGLALLHLAPALDRRDGLLARRRSIAARLAIPVALGFLLLLPLLTSAVLQQQGNQARERVTRVSRATSQLEALRAAVRSATSPQDLGQRLAALQGPQLEASDQGLSLEQLRQRVNAVLDQAAAQIAREQAAIPVQNPWRLAPEILRTSLACLALATGFAGLAQRKDAEVSFLADLLWRLEYLLSRFRLPRAKRNGAVVSPQQMMQRLAEADEGAEPGRDQGAARRSG